MNEEDISRRSDWYDTSCADGFPNLVCTITARRRAPPSHTTDTSPTRRRPPPRKRRRPTAAPRRGRAGVRAVAIGLICLVVIAASSLIFTQDRAAEPTPPAEQTAPSQPGGFDDYRISSTTTTTPPTPSPGENDIPRAELEPDVRLTTAPVPDETEELTLRELYERCIPSVVGITAMVPDGSGYFWGTGIILTEDGYIVTNTHILDGTDSVTVTLWDDRELEAKLVGADNVSDLAVLKVEAEGLTPAEFCGTAVSVGDAVAALGNPLGEELRGTLTDGIISAINRDVSYNSHSMTLLQTNAAINEGNSGGPLLNMYGQVVGITNMKMMGTSAYSAIEGIGFAIPTSTIQEVVNQLLRNGRVTGRAAIGVTIGPIPEDAAAAYSLPDGLYVVSVAEGSDAAGQGPGGGRRYHRHRRPGRHHHRPGGRDHRRARGGRHHHHDGLPQRRDLRRGGRAGGDQRHLLILLTPFPYIFPSLKQTTGPKGRLFVFYSQFRLSGQVPAYLGFYLRGEHHRRAHLAVDLQIAPRGGDIDLPVAGVEPGVEAVFTLE